MRLLNVDFRDITEQQLLSSLNDGLLVTPNVDILVKAQKDKELYDIIRNAEWVVCDSRVLALFSKLTRNPIREAIPGSSFFKSYYTHHSKNPDCKIFLLGGLGSTATDAMRKINESIGREIITGAYSPSYGFDENADENSRIHRMINESGATTVVVGVGCPKQEKWIVRNRKHMPNVRVWMALGATIDFEAGKVKRAPFIVQRLYMEWLYRFQQEPRRLFKRYFIDDLKFFYHFALQLAGKYHNPFANTDSQ